MLTSSLEYTYELMEMIPIRRILSFAETSDSHVYPDLLALTAFHYPELFDIISFLVDEEYQTMYVPIINEAISYDCLITLVWLKGKHNICK